jgi:phospholipid/cholesterol/gamma-HCH transport system permease protein
MLSKTMSQEQLHEIRDFLKEKLLKLCQLLGASLIGFLQATGAFAFFTIRSISHCIRPPFYLSQFARQLLDIGYYCLPVVGLTAMFSGMVLALQSYSGFSRFSAEGAIATANLALSWRG